MKRRMVSILLVLTLILTSGDFTAFAAERTDVVESASEEETVKETCSVGEEEFAEESAVEQEITEESETENGEITDSSELIISTETQENIESISIIEIEDSSVEEFLSNVETELEESDLLSETEAESISEEDKSELDNFETEGDYTYTVSGDNATITGYTGSGGTIIVPVILGNATVTSIGDSAFEGSAVTDVILPNSITSIGDYAFRDCSILENLTLPDSLTSMGCRIIENTMITSIMIPKNITNCSYYNGYYDEHRYAGPLSNCNTLTEVIFEEGIEIIPSYVLCAGLYHTNYVTKVIIPASVTIIGERAFYNCEKIKSIELPKKLNSVGNYAFSGCSSLESLTLPESLISMGYLMVENTAITSITIPKNVASCRNSYGVGPLSNCSALTEVIFEEGLKIIPPYVLSTGSYTNNISKVIIPSSVTSIGNYAFSGCSSLSSLSLPEGVTSIGRYAFSGCS